MALYKWVREYLEKYSFISEVMLMNGIVMLHYKKDGKVKFKRLPFRATKDQLVTCIENIKKDINYYEDKKTRIEEGQYDISTHNPPVFIIMRDNK